MKIARCTIAIGLIYYAHGSMANLMKRTPSDLGDCELTRLVESYGKFSQSISINLIHHVEDCLQKKMEFVASHYGSREPEAISAPAALSGPDQRNASDGWVNVPDSGVHLHFKDLGRHNFKIKFHKPSQNSLKAENNSAFYAVMARYSYEHEGQIISLDMPLVKQLSARTIRLPELHSNLRCRVRLAT